MAIFKHIHKSRRFQDRAGCTDRRDVRRLMDYLARPSAHGKTVWNNFENDSPEGITDEIMALARDDLTYKAYHFMMSFPAGEQSRWEASLDGVLADFAERFRVHRMVWATHEDKDNFHVHGCIFAENAEGRKLRLETKIGGKMLPVAPSLRKMAEDWEDRLGTQTTGRSPVLGTSVSKDCLEMAQREHVEDRSKTPVPAKLQLRAAVGRIVALSHSFEELETQAQAAGIEIRFTQHQNGTGVSFSDGSTSLRGREAGHTFQTLTQLFHDQNPGIERSQPDRGVAERNRSRSSQPTPPRLEPADRHPAEIVGDPIGGRGGQHDPYRRLEATFRDLTRLSSHGGVLFFLQFLTRALDTIARTADTPTRAPRQRRPSL